ncbi:MAG: hypothetical protein V3S53_07350, partial [Gammaproteobacteria bacterium]
TAEKADDKGRPKKPSRRRGRRGRGTSDSQGQAAKAKPSTGNEQEKQEGSETRSRRPQRGPGRTTRGDRSRTQTDRRKDESPDSSPAAVTPDASQATDFTDTQPLKKHESPKPMPLAGTDQAGERKADSKTPADKPAAPKAAAAESASPQPAVSKESRTVYTSSPTGERSGPGRRDDW